MIILSILFLLIVATLFVGVFGGVGSWWMVYWLSIIGLIAVAVTVVVVAIRRDYRPVVDKAVLALKALSDNNIRWLLAWATTIVLLVSAILAGFGEPILVSSWREARESATYKNAKAEAKAAVPDEAKEGFNFWKGVAILVSNGQKDSFSFTEVKEEDKAVQWYPSWWHWPIFFLSILAALAYTPVAFFDELKEAIAKARQKRAAVSAGTAETEGAAATKPQGGWSFNKDLLTDIIGEWGGNILSNLTSGLGGMFR
ncbi:MAG TPA: hypothetical protein PKL09_03930 [bacterium]|nr:hypothetical protein [bacterium]HNS34430.1 hypothetical protein [bacterium]